ncbi:MAG: hypothetical protein ACXWNB_09130 [Candidatus Binataceae bacterium]
MTRVSALALAIGLLGLAACSTEEVNTGIAGSYEGYYDDYYGPISDGYWGPDGDFYFSVAQGQPFQRDGGGHFRHSSATGFHHFHGSYMVGY